MWIPSVLLWASLSRLLIIKGKSLRSIIFTARWPFSKATSLISVRYISPMSDFADSHRGCWRSKDTPVILAELFWENRRLDLGCWCDRSIENWRLSAGASWPAARRGLHFFALIRRRCSHEIQRLSGASLLVFANKTDVNGCMLEQEIQEVRHEVSSKRHTLTRIAARGSNFTGSKHTNGK